MGYGATSKKLSHWRIDVLWLEEAHALTEYQWKILEPTIRKEGSECWFIFNPGLVTDFVWRNFVVDPPEDTLIRKINYDENPFLSDTMLKVIDAARHRDPEGFVHVYEGVPESDDDAAIIKLSWIEAAVDAHKVLGFEPEGRKRIGFDVADSGADKCANVYRHGSVVYWADEWKAKEDELLKSCLRTYMAALERGPILFMTLLVSGPQRVPSSLKLMKIAGVLILWHRKSPINVLMPELVCMSRIMNITVSQIKTFCKPEGTGLVAGG